jgi:hypothetical protein
MQRSFNLKVTTGDGVASEGLHRRGVVVGGMVAGLVVVGLATYSFSSGAKVAPSVDTLLSASECETQPISIVLGQDAEATMTVSRRTRCHIAATGLAMSSIDEFSIIDPPKHGIVMQRGRTGVVYQSDGDYRGKDSFTFAMRGKSADANDGAGGETSTVRAYVTVK